MFSSSARRKSSQRKRTSRRPGKPNLSIDTACTHQKKVGFPYESRIQDLSFVSFEESKARKNAHAQKASVKQQPENVAPVQPGPELLVPQLRGSTESVRSHRAAIIAPESVVLPTDGSLALPFNKRIKGLRPSPLDLTRNVSPSDRVIPIGIVLSPSTVSNRSPSPGTGRFEQETPMIVITPSSEHPRDRSYRPASSVYSRYTNCYPKSVSDNRTPPVPPLPLFINTDLAQSKATGVSKESATTVFEETDSARTEDLHKNGAHHVTALDSRRSMPQTAGLPTPRRSKGWWNVLTSPFSAKSAKSLFWRSPPLRDNQADRKPVLGDAAGMGVSDPNAGVIFTNRRYDDEELRSAPASSQVDCDNEQARSLPKRSDTAPGALDSNAAAVNIYWIPGTGEAAPYYDTNRHFPSLYLQSRSMGGAGPDGWSPSQSVYIPGRHSRSVESDIVQSPEVTVLEAALEAEGITFGTKQSALERSAFSPLSSPGMSQTQEYSKAAMFSTPSQDELKTPPRTLPQPSRGFTQTTDASFMSPLSATPVVQDAHMGRFVGPQSSFGEQKQVDVERTPVPQGPGLAAATMAHRENNDVFQNVSSRSIMEKKPSERPAHVRQDSCGLGISAGERDLYPAPIPLSEKPRLGTDRFGQLTIRSWDDDKPQRPWYKRFFWLLAAGASSLLLVIIVLLVVFIPQRHDDVAIQASWVNLTGFPALPIGVSTVIQPKNTESSDSCVSPADMWSCAAPGQDSDGLPNFRFQIRFRNGTIPSNETDVATTSSSSTKRWQDSSRLHQLVKRNLWTDFLYSASPAAPSQSDQEFLGRTTDNITQPHNGEETPFYLSLLDAVALASTSLRKRDEDFSYPYPNTSGSSNKKSNASTAAAKDIPSPALKPNGEPIDQLLYPLVSSQPLRLYNRGKDTEHYGFYTYYDRTIYISAASNSTATNETDVTSSVPLNNASAVCTFSQTRLHVQIWTKNGGSVGTFINISDENVAAGNSSANDMVAPGSFPYAVSITIDRHGGEAEKKGIYCYSLDEDHQVIGNAKTWLVEDRSVGGLLVNAAAVPGGDNTTLDKRDDDAEDGIDGGSGGCGCQWQNWS